LRGVAHSGGTVSARADLALERSPACPKCGSGLAFRTDPLGYGQTIEQCENPRCDYWTTLERIVRPAHVARPRVEEQPRHRASGMRQGPARSPLTDAIVRALPTTEAAAISAGAVARLIQHSEKIVAVRLPQLVKAGHPLIRRYDVALAGRQRPAWRYWRLS
jgi:hypothetical protein